MRALSPNEAARAGVAARLLAQRRIVEALAVASALRLSAPDAADAWHIEAICLADAGQVDRADAAFIEADRLAPGQPLILANRARWLARIGRNEQAVHAWRELSAAAPANAEAWLGQGNAALALRQFADALTAFQRAASLGAPAAKTAQGAAAAMRGLDDLEGAERVLRDALVEAPESVELRVAMASIHRLKGQPEAAIECYESLARAGVSSPAIVDAHVGVLIDAIRLEEAHAMAMTLVAAHPRFAPGQVTLAQLQWEYPLQPEGCDPLQQFRGAVRQAPDDPALQLSLAGFLLEAGQPDEALPLLETLRRRDDTPLLQAMLANACERLGEYERAASLYALADPALGGSDPDFNNAVVRHLLRAGRWAEAARRAERTLALDPQRQETWAYLATAWRLLGDPREQWLCGYESLVTLLDVGTPPGWSSQVQFLGDLATCLLRYHRARREPVSQSLRGGSQTPGRLFGRDDAPIVALRDALIPRIESWVRTLPVDPGHPFLRRRAECIGFTGSWSVRLWRAGSHANHFHNEGWMSSAFYVSLPPSTEAGSGGAGCIQFGQPPVELQLGLPPRRVIRPIAGHVALFPSYVWHGTVPFDDDAPRMTVAFDMLPRP